MQPAPLESSQVKKDSAPVRGSLSPLPVPRHPPQSSSSSQQQLLQGGSGRQPLLSSGTAPLINKTTASVDVGGGGNTHGSKLSLSSSSGTGNGNVRIRVTPAGQADNDGGEEDAPLKAPPPHRHDEEREMRAMTQQHGSRGGGGGVVQDDDVEDDEDGDHNHPLPHNEEDPDDGSSSTCGHEDMRAHFAAHLLQSKPSTVKIPAFQNNSKNTTVPGMTSFAPVASGGQQQQQHSPPQPQTASSQRQGSFFTTTDVTYLHKRQQQQQQQPAALQRGGGAGGGSSSLLLMSTVTGNSTARLSAGSPIISLQQQQQQQHPSNITNANTTGASAGGLSPLHRSPHRTSQALPAATTGAAAAVQGGGKGPTSSSSVSLNDIDPEADAAELRRLLVVALAQGEHHKERAESAEARSLELAQQARQLRQNHSNSIGGGGPEVNITITGAGQASAQGGASSPGASVHVQGGAGGGSGGISPSQSRRPTTTAGAGAVQGSTTAAAAGGANKTPLAGSLTFTGTSPQRQRAHTTFMDATTTAHAGTIHARPGGDGFLSDRRGSGDSMTARSESMFNTTLTMSNLHQYPPPQQGGKDLNMTMSTMVDDKRIIKALKQKLTVLSKDAQTYKQSANELRTQLTAALQQTAHLEEQLKSTQHHTKTRSGNNNNNGNSPTRGGGGGGGGGPTAAEHEHILSLVGQHLGSHVGTTSNNNVDNIGSMFREMEKESQMRHLVNVYKSENDALKRRVVELEARQDMMVPYPPLLLLRGGETAQQQQRSHDGEAEKDAASHNYHRHPSMMGVENGPSPHGGSHPQTPDGIDEGGAVDEPLSGSVDDHFMVVTAADGSSLFIPRYLAFAANGAPLATAGHPQRPSDTSTAAGTESGVGVSSSHVKANYVFGEGWAQDHQEGARHHFHHVITSNAAAQATTTSSTTLKRDAVRPVISGSELASKNRYVSPQIRPGGRSPARSAAAAALTGAPSVSTTLGYGTSAPRTRSSPFVSTPRRAPPPPGRASPAYHNGRYGTPTSTPREGGSSVGAGGNSTGLTPRPRPRGSVSNLGRPPSPTSTRAASPLGGGGVVGRSRTPTPLNGAAPPRTTSGPSSSTTKKAPSVTSSGYGVAATRPRPASPAAATRQPAPPLRSSGGVATKRASPSSRPSSPGSGVRGGSVGTASRTSSAPALRRTSHFHKPETTVEGAAGGSTSAYPVNTSTDSGTRAAPQRRHTPTGQQQNSPTRRARPAVGKSTVDPATGRARPQLATHNGASAVKPLEARALSTHTLMGATIATLDVASPREGTTVASEPASAPDSLHASTIRGAASTVGGNSVAPPVMQSGPLHATGTNTSSAFRTPTNEGRPHRGVDTPGRRGPAATAAGATATMRPTKVTPLRDERDASNGAGNNGSGSAAASAPAFVTPSGRETTYRPTRMVRHHEWEVAEDVA